jgi:hypothetical protein
MFIIEKSSRPGILGKFTANESHFWEPAWPKGQAYLDASTIDEAILMFFEKTSKVRSASYRLLLLSHRSLTLAAINTSDADTFKKFVTYAVGFTDEQHSVRRIYEPIGIVLPSSGGIAVGTAMRKNNKVEDTVESIAQHLQATIQSHDITTRFNSSGESGGAFLVTDPIDGIMSNTDVGISYGPNAYGFRLMVSNKYLADPESGNCICPFTQKMDHESIYGSLEDALKSLKKLVRHATEDELQLLCA